MAKRINIDEQSLAEPIEIRLEGKEYIVKSITTDLMAKVAELGKNKDDLDAPVKQLALLIGVNHEELLPVDIRKIGKALKYITDCIKEGMDDINPSGAEAKQ